LKTSALFPGAFLLCVLAAANTSWAAFLFDAGIKAAYEDNINGSPADAGRVGDFYTTLFVVAGGYREVTEEKTYAVLKGGIERYSYNKYDALNAVIGTVSAGLYHISGEVLTSYIAVKAKGKDFEDKDRDSSSLGAAIEFKQRLTDTFWLKEAYEYERNDARSTLFTYGAHSAGVWAGVTSAPRAFFGVGYSYLYRRYDDQSHYTSQSHTLSASVEYKLSRRVYVSAGYDRQFYDVSDPAATYTDNIYTAGLVYSY
jgi:hypothetical protein